MHTAQKTFIIESKNQNDYAYVMNKHAYYNKLNGYVYVMHKHA